MQPARPLCFTIAADGIRNVLRAPVGVTQFSSPEEAIRARVNLKWAAIWDTGASNSTITQKIIDECQLKPTGMIKVSTANGIATRPTYIANIYLPNGVVIGNIKVTGVPDITGGDMLIGMDIMNRGDFAVTNFQGKTIFSFRFPSCEHIDFVAGEQSRDALLKAGHTPIAGRNDPCPCGSKKKYKKCCGAPGK